MDECIKRFGEQVRDVIKVFEEKKRVAISEIEEKIKNLTGYL